MAYDSAARHVTLRERTGPKGKVHIYRFQAMFYRQSIARKVSIQVPTSLLSEHLKGLYEQSAKGKSKMKCVLIQNLLLKHANVFSKDDYDLAIPTWLNIQLTLGMQNPLSSHLDGWQ